MLTNRKQRVLGTCGLVVLLGGGCMTASVDRDAAKAQDKAPSVAQVPELNIPYAEEFPTYVVAVEPLSYGAAGVTSGGGPASAPSANRGVLGGLFGGSDPATGGSDWNRQHDDWVMQSSGNAVGDGMAAQLLTALSRSGNIQVVEIGSLQRGPDGSLKAKLEKGEIGPFVIRGTVTEFNETADASEKKKGGSLGPLGAAMGLIGGIMGNDTVAATGAGVAVANPTMEKGEMKRSGMVGFDLRLVNAANGRVVGAFNSSGAFTTVSSVAGTSLFGIGSGGSEFAASALGQATRAAMNDAVQKATDLLKQKVRPKVEAE